MIRTISNQIYSNLIIKNISSFSRITNIPKYQLSVEKPNLKISQVIDEQQQSLSIRLPFIQQNHLHLQQIYQICKKPKHNLKIQYEAFLQTLKVNMQKNEKLFKVAMKQNQDLYQLIKNQILIENQQDTIIYGKNSDFIQKAHYYFQKQGKKIRPLMLKLLQNCLVKKMNIKDQQIKKQISKKIKKWSALIQILHIASLAHDDVIDDSPSRRGQISQHIKYGKRAAVFSGNYIISKASRQIYEFQSSKLFQIYSVTMDNLATGQIIQALTKNKLATVQSALQPIIENYINKTYYKTAALMANSMRAVPLLCNNQNQAYQMQSFRIGQHFGVAFQIVDDILDYISTQAEMGKQQVADIRQGNVTAPIYFTLYQEKQNKSIQDTIKQLKKKNKTKQQALQIKKWVVQGTGIQLSFLLAYKHVQTGLNYLREMGVSQYQLGPWKYLGYKLLTRRK